MKNVHPHGPGMKRRAFLQKSSIGVVGMISPLLLRAQQTTDPASEKRPNILFIMTDQQYAGAMSNAGNRDLHTPSMDLLAHRGVSFTKAYCTNPICVPSRTSLITGRMPHATTVTFNTDEHEIAASPLSPLMKAHGYATGYVGKWHIPHDATDTTWHGFDFVAHARGNRLDNDVPGSVEEFLQQERDKPFFLVASFVNPHDICEWARQASGIKDPLPNGPIPAPPPPEECPSLPFNHAIAEDEPSVIREHQKKLPRAYPVRDWDADTWRQYRWAYNRLTEKVDGQIGQILDSLKRSGQWDNTVIVFTSDHGDGLGAHAWNQKTLFYEEVSRIPLIVTDLRKTTSERKDTAHLVSMNIDLFPTFFDYAGIQPPQDLPGISLRPIVEERAAAPSHPFIISQSDLHTGYGSSGGVYGRMVRTQQYKYVVYSEGENREQLFDLEQDPGEMVNLARAAS
ncbi:MAG TPA: sulfatase-like hydrolase/transferase, partial [Oceanipulchritudo sp.]|nr:sulfatase-like hydrolase/transferase [Oceanipulchritudo sp.]